jgi:hypothetical protein
MPEPRWPAWLTQLADPNQASVFDSTGEQLKRRVAQALIGEEFVQSAMNASPAVAMVPREAQADLVARLMQSWGQSGQHMPAPIQQAIEILAQRFPRIMSHIQGVEPHPSADPRIRGEFLSMPSEWNGRAGVIQVNPNQTPEQLLQTLTHELTHGGQQLRAVSHGTDINSMFRLYNEGYFSNPLEIRARTAQINQALKRGSPIRIEPLPDTPGARLKAAREHATNPFADEWMKR